MERYDGKTRRDDYIKYGLITLGVLVVLGLLIWFTGFMKARRQSNPDFLRSCRRNWPARKVPMATIFPVLPSGARSVWRTFPSTPVCWTMEIRKK